MWEPTLDDIENTAVKNWIQAETERPGGLATSTKKNFVAVGRIIDAFLGELAVSDPTELSEEDILRLVERLSEYNGHTAYQKWTRIRRFLRAFGPSISDDLIRKTNQGLRVDSEPLSEEAPPVTSEDIEVMLAEVSSRLFETRDGLLIALLWESGMSVGEAVRIELEDVDRQEQIIHIPPSKSTGHRGRVVAYRDHTQRLFDKWLPGDSVPTGKWVSMQNSSMERNWLFPSQQGGRLSAEAAGGIVREIAESAGVQETVSSTVDGRSQYKITPQTIRQGYEQYLLDCGVDPMLVDKLMGHSVEASDVSQPLLRQAAPKAGKNPEGFDGFR